MVENAFTRKKKQKLQETSRPATTLDDLTLANPEDEPVIPEGQIFELPATFFYPDSDQVRKDFDEHALQELAESLKNHKQMQPIVVYPADEKGRYKIDKGERRWRASQLIEGFKLKAVIDPEAPSRNMVRRIFGQLVENDQRENLRPLETAIALKVLIDEGLTMEEVATGMGWLTKTTHKPNANKVSRILSILKLPEEGQALARDGIVVDVITLEFLRKIFDISPKKFTALCGIAREDGGLTRSRAEQEFKQCKFNEQDLQPASTSNGGPDPAGKERVDDHTQNTNSPTEAGKVKVDQPNADAKEEGGEGTPPAGLSVVPKKVAPTEPKQTPPPNTDSQVHVRYPKIKVDWRMGKGGIILFNHNEKPEPGSVFIKLTSGDIIQAELDELTLKSIEE
jgi:ParB family chromosome partitioning protein